MRAGALKTYKGKCSERVQSPMPGSRKLPTYQGSFFAADLAPTALCGECPRTVGYSQLWPINVGAEKQVPGRGKPKQFYLECILYVHVCSFFLAGGLPS